MVEYDWGLDEPPHPLGRSLDERSDLEVGQLPEVRALLAEGWFLAPEAPVLAFLPAIWPRSARTWIPDRSTHYAIVSTLDGDWNVLETCREPWTQTDHDTYEIDINVLLGEGRVPPRPAGRIWLLRPPPGFSSLDEAVDHLQRRAREAGVDLGLVPELVAVLTAEVRVSFIQGWAPRTVTLSCHRPGTGVIYGVDIQGTW